MSVDLKVKGHAVNNLLRAKLKKLNKDTSRYRLPQFMAMSAALLAKGGKLQLNLNKVDVGKAME